MNPTTTIAAKHIMNTPETLVSESIQGLCYTNPNLRIIEKHKVVYYAKVKEMALNQVTLISGGGSGHEPGYAGFVGKHGLAASVCGHVFASPSSSQVLAAIQKVASPHGTLVIIMNYTGDCLNFGLAVERAKAQGINVDFIAVGDDIAIASNDKVGRRGLAATALAIKMAGALASQGATLAQVKQMVQYVIDHSVTLGVALDHCHVPGSSSFSTLDKDQLELGMGIHNEPGFTKTAMMSAKELVDRMMTMLFNQKDPERSFLKLSTGGNSCVLLVNNLGGLSQLELNLAVKHAVEYILFKHDVKLQRVYVGPFVTSLNMPGFSLTLLLVDNQDKLDLLDQPVHISGWPSCPAYSFSEGIIEQEEEEKKTIVDVKEEEKNNNSHNTKIREAICSAAHAVIEAEPLITEYDTVLGDGDCGQTLKTAALAILQAVPNYPFYSLPKTVQSIADTIEQSVGGTSSAIYCIYLNALANALSKNDNLVYAARDALESLKRYTHARRGDRTLMDTLCPFIDILNDKGSNMTEALQAAKEGCESTCTMSAKLGRASYLFQDQVIQSGLPDAGAYGLLQLLNSLFPHHYINK